MLKKDFYAKKLATQLLQKAGITLNGSAPYDLQVHNEALYFRTFSQGALGLGEAYMDKWWDCERLDIFFEKVLRAHLEKELQPPFRVWLKRIVSKFINFQSRPLVKKMAKTHYDLGNSLFTAMLGKKMMYSCGYFKDTADLDAAQTAKLRLSCEKLQLKPGLRVLDIGCGFGEFAKFASENYGVEVVGITISKQQYEFAEQYCKNLPVEIRCQDYRDIKETFDRVISIGMFEHVGYNNYPLFMKIVNQSLRKDGIFLLHTIGIDEPTPLTNEWTSKYIFTAGSLPSLSQIAATTERKFVMEDWQNFGAYYDPTLMAWHQNFVHHWPQLSHHYDERFYRMWTYYLLSCAGAFRARTLQLWQVVFSHDGIEGGYQSPR